MREPSLTVLFLSRRNSVRSILAEALLNASGKGRFMAMSAGIVPAERVHPLALGLLNRNHLPTDFLRPKHWREFRGPYAPHFDFVVKLCEFPPGEIDDDWPGAPIRASWVFPDPELPVGSLDALRNSFLRCYTEIDHRLRILVSLPLQGLDRETIRQRLGGIGYDQSGNDVGAMTK